MKKIFKKQIVLLLLPFLLTACGTPARPSSSQEESSSEISSSEEITTSSEISTSTSDEPISSSSEPISSSTEPISSSSEPISSTSDEPISSSSDSISSYGSEESSTTDHSSSVTTTTSEEPQDYYASIGDSLQGTDLLNALLALNSSKRKSQVGYSSMGTSASGQFKYTDYDPNSVQYDSNGQPYGTVIVSFYSGNTMTSFNREHVWPNSHGGSVVENDIHMPRPTIPSENGSRGNSFYVEGMKHTSQGWDPAMESFGEESYRGDSARIIFYCCIADSRLTLLDDTYHETSKKNPDYKMGKLTDMLSWNLAYEVKDREQRRNAGAEYLQGNRNPFIDHPEYACRIWGRTNSETKRICGLS